MMETGITKDSDKEDHHLCFELEFLHCCEQNDTDNIERFLDSGVTITRQLLRRI
jgi:hypothetical protein